MVHIASMKPDYPLTVVFYKSDAGKEPVRIWLKKLPSDDRKVIGEDIKTLQYGWPLGMPLVKSIDTGLWEIRSNLTNRIARILFTIYEHHIVLLHGFIKKTKKTPSKDLALSKNRMSKFKKAGNI
jgi:phage-related protein